MKVIGTICVCLQLMEQLDCVCDAALPSWETHGNIMVGSL